MRRFFCLALLLLLAAPALAQNEAERAVPGLAARLRQGGYVLVMRHASSPMNLPDKSTADPENTGLERQLDRQGRDSAGAMGRALRALAIPIGEIVSSPTYRARETIRLMDLPAPQTAAELGENGQNMAASSAQQGAWLRAKTTEAPAPGRNNLFVTHFPNIRAAFPDVVANGIADGEMLVFQPDGKGHADLIARVKIEAWPAMAADK
jgi:phosphohistidine phosphatase SixA